MTSVFHKHYKYAIHISILSVCFCNGLGPADKGVVTPLCFSGPHTWQAVMETAALCTCWNNGFMQLLNLNHSFLLPFPAKCAY